MSIVPRSSLRVRLIFLLGITAAALATAEVGLRALGVPAEWDFRRPNTSKNWETGVHEASPMPGLAYELRPGVDVEAVGIHIRTNALGLRGPEVSEAKPAGVRRVLAVGDSITFGFGVEEDQAYPRVLEGLLRAEGRRVEVLNLGVAAYNLNEDTARLLSRGGPLQPDLVVVQYFLNDPDLDPFDPLHAYFLAPRWWMRSNLLRLVHKTWWRFELRRWGGNDYYRYLHARPENWRAVTDDLRRMAAWAHSERVPPVLVIFPLLSAPGWPAYPYQDLHDQVAAAARAEGFAVLDLAPVFAAYPQSAMLSPVDRFHPSALAHRIAARSLRDFLVRTALERMGPAADPGSN